MKILVGCEFSGTLRRELRYMGHQAFSCDIVDDENLSPFHIKADVLTLLEDDWDGAVFFPPCTYLTVSGNRWNSPERARLKWDAIEFVERLWNCKIPRVAIENPIGRLSTQSKLGKPEAPHGQIIQPYQFGHGETKATCLWLKNLPLLVPTNNVDEREPRIHHMTPGPERQRERSRTLPGIAKAMADQWFI